MEDEAVRHIFERDPSKDQPCQVWGGDLNVKVHDMTNRRHKFMSTPKDYMHLCTITKINDKTGRRVMVFNVIFNNILVISWQSVLLVEETGVPRENHIPVESH
jgi:hypothetical protein